MDALSDVLRTMRLKGGVYLHAEFTGAWCIAAKVLPSSCAPVLGATDHLIPYHFVTEGRMRGRLEDGTEFEIGPGESVLFPRNDSHLLGSDLSRLPVPSEDIVRFPENGGLASVVHGDGGELTRVVCGFLGADRVRGNPVLSALPPVLRFEAKEASSAAWIRSTFHFAAEQIAAGRMGSESVLGKLSEMLFIEAIQSYTDQLPESERGWLVALRDPYVSRAMALLHARVADRWTVDTLGREVGLSRSALADRFNDTLGVPPMQYLGSWRIHVAAYELLNSGKPIAQIANQVGYDSEASFTRAFRRVMDMPPATWRRQRGDASQLPQGD